MLRNREKNTVDEFAIYGHTFFWANFVPFNVATLLTPVQPPVLRVRLLHHVVPRLVGLDGHDLLHELDDALGAPTDLLAEVVELVEAARLGDDGLGAPEMFGESNCVLKLKPVKDRTTATAATVTTTTTTVYTNSNSSNSNSNSNNIINISCNNSNSNNRD